MSKKLEHRPARQVAMGALTLLAMTTAQAEIRYEVVDLGVELFLTLPKSVPAISSSGLIVGTDTFPAARAYVWNAGQVTFIEPAIANTATIGYDVNASGTVVGVTPGPGYNGPFSRPFVYQNGSLSFIPDLVPNRPSVNARAAYAINDAGAVVGEWEGQAFIFANGVSSALPRTISGAGQISGWTQARDINNNGWVVGTASYQGSAGAVVWHDEQAWDIGTLPLTAAWRPEAGAMAVNDLNQVVGYSRTSLPSGRIASHAFLWSNGQMTDLGSLRGPDWSSVAYGVNDRSQVVGTSNCVGGGCAFIWNSDEGMLQLQKYVDPSSKWLLDTATSINDDGWIVGNGRLDGAPRDFLLIPTQVPEPSAWALAIVGLVTVGGLRRRRTCPTTVCGF
jgi:MYXO-CTERM domain-containing protein